MIFFKMSKYDQHNFLKTTTKNMLSLFLPSLPPARPISLLSAQNLFSLFSPFSLNFEVRMHEMQPNGKEEEGKSKDFSRKRKVSPFSFLNRDPFFPISKFYSFSLSDASGANLGRNGLSSNIWRRQPEMDFLIEEKT